MKKSLVIALGLVAATLAGFVLQQNLSHKNDAAAPQPETSGIDEKPAAQLVASNVVALENYEKQIAEWNGESRLINFWATWCAPCRREIPLLKQLQSEKAEKKLQVVGIAVDNMEDVVAYAEQAQFNYPILVGQEAAMDAAASSGVEFIGLPFTLIVAGDGTLVSTHMGEIQQTHVDRIVAIMQDLEIGALDLVGAREALHTL